MANSLQSGIYEIVNTANWKRYVGSAVKLRYRFSKHRGQLLRGNHHSKILQNAWNAVGGDSFEFRTLLICDRHNLVMYEQIAMDALKPEYNVLPTAGSCLGRVMSDDHKRKIGDANRGRPAIISLEARAKISAANKGRPHGPMSDATKAKVSANRKGKYLGARPAYVGEKIALALRGRAPCAATLEAAVKSNTGRKHSPEHIAKRVAAVIGKKRKPYKKHSHEANAAKSLRQLKRSANGR